MKNMKGKFLNTCLNKCRKMGSKVGPSSTCDDCCQWGLWPSMNKESSCIPNDVPKGHMVVYVGEEYRRFVVKITLLKHPLFKSLLDRAEDECDFNTNSKLWIPCNENLFLSVFRCATIPEDQKVSLCF